WNNGIIKGIVNNNPFKQIPITKEKKIPTTLTIEEKNNIFQKLKHSEAKIGFALARYAGLRRVEICRNIKWENIDFINNIITIPNAKTGENQIVPMISQLKEILAEHKKDNGFVVSLGENTLCHYIINARKEAGINKPGSIRILRHSLGKELLDQGENIRIIQLLLRHSDITTTQIYTHLTVKELSKKLEGKYL
ncbi:tyrosine-type recombinase/integrase, partial [bacterium]|nr:tyrosine-type recombinase/integrase [bacterium]